MTYRQVAQIDKAGTIFAPIRCDFASNTVSHLGQTKDYFGEDTVRHAYYGVYELFQQIQQSFMVASFGAGLSACISSKR